MAQANSQEMVTSNKSAGSEAAFCPVSLLIPRECAAVGRRGGASHATPPPLRHRSVPKERSQGSLVGMFRGDRA